MKFCDDQKESHHVMAETILAGKEVKEFPGDQASPGSASGNEIVTRLAEDLLMRYRPRNTRDGYSQDKEPDDLRADVHAAG